MVKMTSLSSLETLKTFLKNNISSSEYDNLIYNAEDDINAFLQDNFDLFSEDILRKLVSAALQVRDENVKSDGTQLVSDDKLMGAWGTVIDSVREVTAIRQERAGNVFKQVVAVAQKEGPRSTATIISRFYRAGHIDKLFQELLTEAIGSCLKSNTNPEALEMFQFFQKVIDQNKAVDKAKVSLKLMDNPSSALNRQDINIVNTRHESANIAASNLDGSIASDTEKARNAEDEQQHKLISASEYLKLVTDECRGDAAALQKRVQNDLWRGELGFDIEHFSRVVQDTLVASQQAGYVNRVKLLQFIQNRVLEPLQQKMLECEKQEAEETGLAYQQNSEGSDTGGYHAPQFLDDNMRSYHKNILTPDMFLAGFNKEVIPNNKLSKTGQLIKSVVQEEARTVARNFVELAGTMGNHLEAHGWAVCDNFVSADLVRRVRIEAGLFRDHYEQSEIWVGKKADVGTLLSVPSVRGDKVMWLCGGHEHRAAPEGVTRVVKTKGDIEPCRLQAKARAPMRKFSALKELVKACDALVNEMKTKVKAMEGIYERSDAMLANYPGEGARFARHIDNTTKDGRRVTLLIYLNPGWKREDGGALRLTPLDKTEGIDVYPECGRLAMFYSADMPHEVMPTYGDRHAITIWYYDTEERNAALEMAKASGAAEAANRAGSDAQREAKQFIADLMGGDEIESDGGVPTQEELNALRNKVIDLTDQSLGIVASITGAPSVESFRQGFTLLTPQDLKQMRQLFRRMGLVEQH